MKKAVLIIILACLVNSYVVGQSDSKIQDIIVVYTPAFFHEQTLQPNKEIFKPNISITLFTEDSVSLIVLNVLSISSDSLVFQANYDFSNYQLINGLGEEIYSRVNNNILIKDLPLLPLQPYRYELYTINTIGRKSEMFSKIQ